VLRARHVLTMTGPAIDHGWVALEGGRITAIGRRDPPEKGIDLDDVIVMPGLVNAHTHLEFSRVSAPLAAPDGLPGWIRQIVAERRKARGDPSDLPASVQAGLAESAAAGVTTIGEIATAVTQGLAGTYATSGPRVRVFREGLGLSSRAVATAVANCHRELIGLLGRGVAAGLSPHAPYSVAAPLGRRLQQVAIGRGVPLAMHLAESAAEPELIATGGGPWRELLEELGAWPADGPPRLLPWVEWIGLLARAPRSVVVHATHLADDPDAFARLVRHRDRLAVAVCPRTTARLAGVPPPVRMLLDAGLRVALGTDGRGSNPDLSVLSEGRALVDAGLVRPQEALRMATRDGAWALMLEHRCGTLAPGRPADLVLLRASAGGDDPWATVFDPANRIVAVLRCGRTIAGDIPPDRA
jgi:cytosine/adenosine deaminase-related metal-dependent hydrolase